MGYLATAEQNPAGLHQRYVVQKASGEPVDQEAAYFVLRLDGAGDDQQHVAACRAAARAYADHVTSGEASHLSLVGNELLDLVDHFDAMEA